jgi:hypothetical protein
VSSLGQDGDSDGQIESLRALIAAAAQGTEEEAWLILELADVLAERHQSRLAAGDLDGAARDLAQWSADLEEFLARTSARHPAYAAAALGAAFARGEHWSAHGDPADLDAGIQWASTGLTSGTGQEPDASGSDPAGVTDPELVLELRWVLSMLLCDRFQSVRAELDSDDVAAVAAARADRDRVIATLPLVLAAIDSADPRRMDAADALGRMHHDRYDDPWPGALTPDPADLDAAIDLMTQVVVGEPNGRALWYLVLALYDRVELRSGADDLSAADDLNALVSCALRLLAHPNAIGADTADVHELLAAALEDRAGLSTRGRRSDLDVAIVELEAVLAATPVDAIQRPLLAQLAHAYWLRLDGDASRYDEVDQMIGYATQAWEMEPTAGPLPDMTGVYLAVGLQERLRRPGQPFDVAAVNLGIDALERTEPVVDDAELHLLIVVVLGFFLMARGQATGSAADLAAAQPWLLRAADELPTSDSNLAEVTQLLAVGMFLLASMGLTGSHLDRAIALLAAAAERPGSEPDRAAITRAALGQALVLRAGSTACRQDLDDGIAQLVAAYEVAPSGHAYKIATAADLGAALLMRFMGSGDVRDRDAARFYLETLHDLTGRTGAAVRELVSDIDLTITAMRGLLRLAESMGGDASALDDAVQHLRAALAMVTSDHPQYARIRSDLGLALMMRASQGSPNLTDLREATQELTAAVQDLPRGHLMRHLGLMRAGVSLAATASTARDPRLLREAIGYLAQVLDEVGELPGLRSRLAAGLGAAQELLFQLTADPAALDEAARWLEEACQQFASQPGHPQHANSLILLARVRRSRHDQVQAREIGLAALRARGREVLLQTGTARGLGFARQAAAESAEVAAWCLADDQPAAAVDALELGRGLILHAATSFTDIPALLIEAGQPDLAAEWQAELTSGRDLPWDVGLSGLGHVGQLLAGNRPLEVPDGLRGRVLAALAGSVERKLLSPPARAQTAAALARTGADALVYLLAPTANQAGCAILIPAGALAVGARPQVLLLPLLHSSAGPVDDYVTAYADVLAAGSSPAGGAVDPHDQRWKAARLRAIGRWKRSLGKLCDWAWPAAMGPLLEHVTGWELSRPPRLVLVPTGRLSLVPWHAAAGPPDESGVTRHACREAVISYAASGRQFAEGSRRPALDVQAAPVVVGNPTFDLPFAGLEAEAIRDHCYPAGRYLGYASPLGATTPDGPGLPSEVLSLLPTASSPGASMLHLGCHADVTGSAPGRSFLLLAGQQKLMIEAILRRARGRPPRAPGGLVSLAACRSDLAAEEYDEALTLATAFLAAGAVTVVGARWEVPDAPTSVLMFMFHYFMATRAASPRDALRMAQLWMLDPARAAPPEMPEHLARHATRPDLAEVTTWAALTHQGR